MEGKTVLFILAVFGVSLSKLTLAAKWPKCKNQTDLLEYYASIFERNAQRSVVKREMTWTFSCLHAAIIKDENDDSMFSYNIYQCCNKCEFPDFSLCALADYPNWLCGSEAYDCVFSCRDEDSVLEAVVSAGSLGVTRKRELNITDTEATRIRRHLRLLRREKQCYERQCTVKNGVRDCCLINTCVPLNNLVTKLNVKKKLRAQQLKKLAKTTESDMNQRDD